MADLDRSGNPSARLDFWGPIAVVLIALAIWANTAPVVAPGVRDALGRADRHLARGELTLADRDIQVALARSADKVATLRLVEPLYSKYQHVPHIIVAQRIGILTRQIIELNDQGKLQPQLSQGDIRALLSAYVASSYELGQRDAALAGAERLYKMDPNDYSSANTLGYFLADYDVDIDRAESLILRAIELQRHSAGGFGGDVEEAVIVDSLGWVYYRQGRFDEAVRELEKAVRVLPSDAEVRFHLGSAYLEVGDDLRAKIEFRKALACEDKSGIHARVSDSQKKMRYKLHKV
jgi:tetratricopeptide (TPR) repeat protein